MASGEVVGSAPGTGMNSLLALRDPMLRVG